MPESERKERRHSRRVATDLELVLAGLDRTTIQARTVNLSAGGAYLLVERNLAPLAKLELEVELPPVGGEERADRPPGPLRAEAVVVRSEPDSGGEGLYRVGVAFMNMSPADRNRLEDYIDWRLTRSLVESVEEGGVA